jgi:hypothetical protein
MYAIILYKRNREHEPIKMNQPQQYERGRAYFGGARIATQEYCPPATGNALQISAKEYATAMLQTLTPTQLQIITGGPPELIPTTSEPASAVQLWRFSSNYLRLK